MLFCLRQVRRLAGLGLLIEFALIDSASSESLGSGFKASYTILAVSGPAPADGPDSAAPAWSCEVAAALMGRVTAEVLALLQER